MKNIFLASVALLLLLIVGACNKSSQLGANLFDGDKLNLTFSDTLVTVVAQTENPDSVLALSISPAGATTSLSLLPWGKMYDNVFGVTEARIFSNFYYNSTTFALDGGATYTLDSVMLVMAYNAAGTYGDTTDLQKISLYRLDASELHAGDNLQLFSNKKYKTEATPLGSLSFTPQPKTYIRRDTNYFRPHIAFRLNDAFGKALLDTSVTSIYNAAYGGDIRKYFRGFELRPEKTTNALLSFNVADDSSGIYIYYKKTNDTAKYSYRFPFTSSTYPYFNHNYAVGSINKFLTGKKTAVGDSLLFIQGMAGPNVKIEFPNLKKQLAGAVVNRAELEFTVLEDSTDKYTPVQRLILTTANGTPIADLLRSNSTAVTDYGGVPVTEAGNLRRYRCNLSQHLQYMLSGSAGTEIYVIADNTRGLIPSKQESTRRVVLYGTKNPKYRTKLNVYYTRP